MVVVLRRMRRPHARRKVRPLQAEHAA